MSPAVAGGIVAPRPNVLITSAARKAPLVRAFRQATATLGGHVIAADISPLAAALYEADDARLIPRSDDPGFIDDLLNLCSADRIGLVVPTRDEELPVLAAARARFDAAGTLVLVSPPDAIETCADKARFTSAVAAAGLETPHTFGDPTDATFPVFVKPRRGKGGIDAHAAHDAGALATALAAAGTDAIVQELVDAPELTIDTFLDLEGRAITCVPRERVAVVAGESVISRTVDDPELVAATIRLCRSIGLIGHVTVQAFRTRDRILFIEVNPRYGGAASLGFAAGARTPELAVRMARGETLRPQLGAYETDLVLLRSASDRFVRGADLVRPDAGRESPVPPGWQAVVFDLDDTLYPEHQFVDGGFRAAAELIGTALRRPAAQLHARLWELHAREGRGRLFDTLIGEFRADADDDLVLAALVAYRGHPPHLRPFPGVDRLTRDLRRRGVALGVLSDGQSGVQRRKLAALEPLEGRFGAVVMTDELGPRHAKPSPEGFRIACRLLGVPVARAVYVGNDPRKDFVGARAAGLATIRFGSPPDEGGRVDRAGRPADDADHSARSVEDLARLLLGDDPSSADEVAR